MLRPRPERSDGAPATASARGGFTLVEVMIALGLMASLMAILWGGVIASTQMREVSTVRNEHTRTIQSALRRIQREISMAFVTKIGQIPTNEDQEIRYQTAFIGESDRLDFTNFAHTRTRVGDVASEQAEISYFLRSHRTEDGRLRQDLVRREQAPIDDDPEEGGYVFTLLEDVEDVEFEYWKPDREIAGDSWERSWDTRDTGVQGLPPRVRLTLEVRDPLLPRRTETYVVEAEIHLTDAIGFEANIINAVDPAAADQIQNLLSEESDDFSDDEFNNPEIQGNGP